MSNGWCIWILQEAVIKVLDGFYANRDYARFYVLETIARVPYFGEYFKTGHTSKTCYKLSPSRNCITSGFQALIMAWSTTNYMLSALFEVVCTHKRMPIYSSSGSSSSKICEKS